MSRDHRVVIEGRQVPFSCENRRFRTNLGAGEPHSPFSDSRGSAIAGPLVLHDGYSLWLEHVEEIESGVNLYWLMWYDNNGVPTIPLSGVFDETELKRMTTLLSK